MAKFKKSEMKKSLLEGITLMMKKEDDFLWAEYHEIEDYINKGYIIFNPEKKEHYEKINK